MRLKDNIIKRDNLVFLFLAILSISLFLFNNFFKFTIINGSSMEPTLNNSELKLIRLDKNFEYNCGDIIVFYDNKLEKYLIKRIVALENDTLKIENNNVFLNDILLDENYILEQQLNVYNHIEVTIPIGHVYVLGDNRNNSIDSRALGPIPLDNVVGKLIGDY